MKIKATLCFLSIFFYISLLLAQNTIITTGTKVFSFPGPCSYIFDYKIVFEKSTPNFYTLYGKLSSNNCTMKIDKQYWIHYNYNCDVVATEKERSFPVSTEWVQIDACVNEFPTSASINGLEIVDLGNKGTSQYVETLNKSIVISKPQEQSSGYGWTDWIGDWRPIDCYKSLSYHLRYKPLGGEQYTFEIEFKNDYSEVLDFNYVLEDKKLTHSIKNSEAIEVKAYGSTKIGGQRWQKSGGGKVEDMSVIIYDLLKGYKKYTECLPVTPNIEVTTYNQNNVKQIQAIKKEDKKDDKDDDIDVPVTKPKYTAVDAINELNGALEKINDEQKAKNDKLMYQIKTQCKYGKCPKCGGCLIWAGSGINRRKVCCTCDADCR